MGVSEERLMKRIRTKNGGTTAAETKNTKRGQKTSNGLREENA